MDTEDLCIHFLSNARSSTHQLIIGEDISPIPEIKIIFNEYGYDEETDTEGGNLQVESYSLFVHKNSLDDGFIFPEHEQTGWSLLVHRPLEEVCVYAAYDVDEDCWHINYPEDSDHNSGLTYESVRDILKVFYARYTFP